MGSAPTKFCGRGEIVFAAGRDEQILGSSVTKSAENLPEIDCVNADNDAELSCEHNANKAKKCEEQHDDHDNNTTMQLNKTLHEHDDNKTDKCEEKHNDHDKNKTKQRDPTLHDHDDNKSEKCEQHQNDRDNNKTMQRDKTLEVHENDDNEADSVTTNETGPLENKYMDDHDVLEFKMKSFEHLRTISEILLDIQKSTGNNNAMNAIKEMKYVNGLNFVLKDKITRQKLLAFTADVAQFMIDIKLFDFFTSVLDGYQLNDDLTSSANAGSFLFILVLSILYNYTDASDALAAKIASSKALKTCKTILEKHSKSHIERKLAKYGESIVESCHGIVHNVSMRDENVELVRNIGLIHVLQPYMKSPSDDTKLTCLTTLANIVNEDECDIIKTNIRSVSHLLEVLEKGLYLEDHRFDGWSCKELALAVRKLARNDANKQILWMLGAVPLLVRLAEDSDEDEKLEAVLAIWSLAFDKEIKEDILTNEELKVVEVLVELQKSSKTDVLKRACERCLWTLHADVEKSHIETNKQAVEEISCIPKPGTKEVKKGHIMISYQSAHRDVLKRIRDKLIDHNYKVWIDVDEMEGSTLQAMANAIEHAAVVLLCYSRQYKDSQYCQSEAEYAYNRKKCIVPLKMEREYTPDGWLGILIGQKYFVEFSGKYEFELKFKDLLKQIKGATEKTYVEISVTVPEKELAVVSAPPPEVSAIPERVIKTQSELEIFQNLSQIRKWTKADVSKWLEKHHLMNKGLDQITGEEISLLAQMQAESPYHIYDCIKNELKLKTLLDRSRLVWALYEVRTNN